MSYNVNKLPLNDLKAYDFDKNYDCIEVAAPYFIRDGKLFLSAEDPVWVADYYAEFGLEIDPKVVEWAKANGGYWEWVNPGCLEFCLD